MVRGPGFGVLRLGHRASGGSGGSCGSAMPRGSAVHCGSAVALVVPRCPAVPLWLLWFRGGLSAPPLLLCTMKYDDARDTPGIRPSSETPSCRTGVQGPRYLKRASPRRILNPPGSRQPHTNCAAPPAPISPVMHDESRQKSRHAAILALLRKMLVQNRKSIVQNRAFACATQILSRFS